MCEAPCLSKLPSLWYWVTTLHRHGRGPECHKEQTLFPPLRLAVWWAVGWFPMRKHSGCTQAFSVARAGLSWVVWGRWAPTLRSPGHMWVNTHMHSCPFHLKQNHWLRWAPIRPNMSTDNSLPSLLCGPWTAGVRSRAPHMPAGLLLYPFALRQGI